MMNKKRKLELIKAQQKPKRSVTANDPQVRAIMKDRQTRQFFRSTWKDGPQGGKRSVTQVLKTDMWKGKRCFIVGGGPSLTGFDFSVLEDENTIGINRVYEFMDCSIMFSMDGRYHQWCSQGKYGEAAKRRFVNFQGLKLWLDIANFKLSGIFYIRSVNLSGVSFRLENGLYHGNNSGYGALNLAVALGANPIYLLGFDMSFDEKGKSHFHSGHPTPLSPKMMKSFPCTFEKTADDLRKRGIKIINCNPKSKLKCYPFGGLPADTGKKKRPVYVSYYTNNSYQKLAMQLRDDIWRHTLRCNIVRAPEQGSWARNTQFKSVYLRQMLDKYPGHPIVWVDADARIRQYPKLFDDFKGDMGVYFRDRHDRLKRDPTTRNLRELLSGTIYLANNNKTRKLMDMWIAENKKDPTTWDQKTLSKVIKNWDGVVEEIPPTYCQIFDSMKNKGGLPVIEHFQASRKLSGGRR